MKILQSGKNTLYIANSMLREERRLRVMPNMPLNRLVPYLVGEAYRMFGIKNQEIFLEFCKSLTHPKKDFSTGILYAHGDRYFGRWCYHDGFFPKSVQKWVDKYDGLHDLLLLHSCNPGHAKPVIRKSIAVVPTDDISQMLNLAGLENLLVIPERGAIPFNKESQLSLTNLQPYENV